MNSTLEKDKEEYKECLVKKRNKAEKLKKNVLLLKLFQRFIIDEQMSLVNQNILSLLKLKDEYLQNIFLYEEIDHKK